MIAGVIVVEVTRDGQRVPLGRHNFVSMPLAGNRIVLPNKIGGLAAYDVARVEHSPCRTDPETLAEKLRTEKGPWCLIEVTMTDPMFEI